MTNKLETGCTTHPADARSVSKEIVMHAIIMPSIMVETLSCRLFASSSHHAKRSGTTALKRIAFSTPRSDLLWELIRIGTSRDGVNALMQTERYVIPAFTTRCACPCVSQSEVWNVERRIGSTSINKVACAHKSKSDSADCFILIHHR
jgi:hypothetical protein